MSASTIDTPSASNGILHRIDGAIEPEPAQEMTDPQKQQEEGDEPPR